MEDSTDVIFRNLFDHRKSAHSRGLRKSRLKASNRAKNSFFDVLGTLLNRESITVVIRRRTPQRSQEITSFWLKKNCKKKFSIFIGLEVQPEVEIAPTKLYMGERESFRLFQNIYFVLAILNGYEAS